MLVDRSIIEVFIGGGARPNKTGQERVLAIQFDTKMYIWCCVYRTGGRCDGISASKRRWRSAGHGSRELHERPPVCRAVPGSFERNYSSDGLRMESDGQATRLDSIETSQAV